MSLLSLFKKLLFFLLPVILIAGIFEIILHKIPNDLSYKLQQFERKSENINTLILGGSHAYYDLNPSIISPEAFNMAYVSQSLEFDYQILKKYISRIPNLRTLVLDISYVSLSQRWNETEVNWRKFYYYKYYGIIPPLGPKIQKYFPELFIVPFNRSLIKMNNYYMGETLITCTEDGWCYNYYKTDRVMDLETNAKHVVKRHENGSMDFSPGIASLTRIIELCKNRNVKIILVCCPVTPEYMNCQNRVKYNKIFDTCQEFSNGFSFIEYYNYSQDTRMNNEDFYDADHLNSAGAMKFSIIFKKEVLEK